MRRFHSYGPVDCRHHFCVPRENLVARCAEQLVGIPEEFGHYFTLWGPRQTGKTWLMHQAKAEIERRYPERFIIGTMSCQGVILNEADPEDAFLKQVPFLMLEGFKREVSQPGQWKDWSLLFHKQKGIFERPVLLFIDEFDSLPPKVMDRLVSLFRNIYLNQKDYQLHGLALIGVRAVLGVDSERGSPFNIQRSLHVPNFIEAEVADLFSQYQAESGQKVSPEVVSSLYEATRGQPGLVSWFGELLTETYNPGTKVPIDKAVWEVVYEKAIYREWNNTVLNLIKKAKGPYLPYILELFTHSDIRFRIDSEWCSYAYLNGIIDAETIKGPQGLSREVCRFSSPFIQHRLYNALTPEIVGERLPVLALDPLDKLIDVFDGPDPDMPALLKRYQDYLQRLKARGIDPWQGQPRRSDLHYTEYVGHFHLYFWLQNAVGRRCGISPEFPTGNGRVDLHLRCGQKEAVIAVKSFRDQAQLEDAKAQALGYAKALGFSAITLALFVPVEDPAVLEQLSEEIETNGVRVTVVAIRWV